MELNFYENDTIDIGSWDKIYENHIKENDDQSNSETQFDEIYENDSEPEIIQEENLKKRKRKIILKPNIKKKTWVDLLIFIFENINDLNIEFLTAKEICYIIFLMGLKKTPKNHYKIIKKIKNILKKSKDFDLEKDSLLIYKKIKKKFCGFTKETPKNFIKIYKHLTINKNIIPEKIIKGKFIKIITCSLKNEFKKKIKKDKDDNYNNIKMFKKKNIVYFIYMLKDMIKTTSK